MKALSLIFLIFPLTLFAQTKLAVSENGRFLQYDNGKPFFWLGDTAWELFHRLDKEESEQYLKNRAYKGFTVIQAVVLAELDGLNTPNREGEIPLIGNDPLKPNEAYFKHVDFVIDKAKKLGLFIGLLPTWGDKFNKRWGVGPEIFTPENALAYGKFLANRYKNKPIIWILGGDRIPEDEVHYQIIDEMAKGIRSVVGQSQIITYHPSGESSSSKYFHDRDWLDMNLFQSGHGHAYNPNYQKTLNDYKLKPIKPVIDGEPCYEDHPINWRSANGWFDAFESRRAAYWSVLSGACGNTYGNHNIWQMWQEGLNPISQARSNWWQALDFPGAFQAGYMRKFFESRPWQLLVPEENLISEYPNDNGKDCRAALASDKSFAMVYIPYGNNVTVDLSMIAGDAKKLWWYSPVIGKAIFIDTIQSNAKLMMDPPDDEKRGNDWVLVIDQADKDFPKPE
ncbi:glycoside hydrolase family 140 protein [Chondrinema litorale]|uniref:glycoside hydrolase family 140 protein n=1 Tax=Chondrinema litorale TaxID=2994555 RepID=UPI0025430936|nr:glycoside hydrolase family 140 protein [Chondrinema litorale]UZR98335.1 glycoside hydrolase family 140 protein [Chondrinema litorale]